MHTLYHGTSDRNLDCIKRLGLVPGHSKGGDAWAHDHHMNLVDADGRPPSVFVAIDVANASDFAKYAVEEIGGKPVIITLHVPEHVFSTFVPDEAFESSESTHPVAWRAHSVPKACIGEVIPAPDGPTAMEMRHTLFNLFKSLMAESHHEL